MTKSIADGFPSRVVEGPFDRAKDQADIPEVKPDGRIMRAAKTAGAVVLASTAMLLLYEGATYVSDHVGSTDQDAAARVANELSPTEQQAIQTINHNEDTNLEP